MFIRRKEGHCLSLTPGLELPLTELARWPWSLPVGVEVLWLPADSAGLSDREKAGHLYLQLDEVGHLQLDGVGHLLFDEVGHLLLDEVGHLQLNEEGHLD